MSCQFSPAAGRKGGSSGEETEPRRERGKGGGGIHSSTQSSLAPSSVASAAVTRSTHSSKWCFAGAHCLDSLHSVEERRKRRRSALVRPRGQSRRGSRAGWGVMSSGRPAGGSPARPRDRGGALQGGLSHLVPVGGDVSRLGVGRVDVVSAWV